MPNALQAAGSSGRKQTAGAPIFVNQIFTGLWTQGNPLRDRATPQLIQKFYQGTRNDSMIDGLNVEISPRLTLKRRCGASIYNSQTFPPIQRFEEFRLVSGNPPTESIIMVADTANYVYNATGPSTKTVIFTKSSGAGQTSFQSVSNTLYFGNGVDQKKWLQPGAWFANAALATTTYAIGTNVLDSNGNLQYLNAFKVGNITNVVVQGYQAVLTFNNTNFSLVTGMSFTPAGLTAASFLNGQKLIAQSVVPSGATFIVTAFVQHANYASASDSGAATTTDVGTPVTTGGTAPTWNASLAGTTTDGLSTWTNFGTPVYNWGAPAPPAQAPTTGFISGAPMGFWRPRTVYGGAVIVDATGLLQQGSSSVVSGVSNPSGNTLPKFSEIPIFGTSLTGPSSIKDAGVTWYCVGAITNQWVASQAIPAGGLGGYCIVDSNGNVQQATNAGTTGSTSPTWNTTYGGNTTDAGVTWENLGPCLALSFQGRKYGYCYHCVDGSVSTMSPFSPSTNGLLNGAVVSGSYSTDVQVDSVWVFATTDGGSTPFFLTSIPNNTAGGTWSYTDQNPDANLNEFIEAPQADAGNPPPIGATALTYHLGRVFYAVGNVMGWSAGPDSEFNGATAFPPLNNYVLPSKIVRYLPLTIGLLIFTTSGVYFSGIGGANNDLPLAPAPWMQGKVGGLLSYNALDVVGSTIYLVNSKAMAKAIDIASGESEVGFPIGDVLANGTDPLTIGSPNQGFSYISAGSGVGIIYLPVGTVPSWAATGDYIGILCSNPVLNVGSTVISGVSGPYTINGQSYTGIAFALANVSINFPTAVTGVLWETTSGAQPSFSGINPAACYVSYHEQNSTDCGLYLAEPGAAGAAWWYRMNPTPAPETGSAWSPLAVSATGFSAVQSVETSPGTHQLLMGPPTGGTGPILFRDPTTFADNGAPYAAYADIGALVLAFGGQCALIYHVVTDCVAVGSRPTVSVLMQNIGGHSQMQLLGSVLSQMTADPPQLGPAESLTVYNDRWWMSSTQEPAWCRYVTIEIAWPVENQPNELLTYTLFGEHYQEV